MKPRYLGISLFLIFSFIGQLNAQCLFSCNGQVNVSLDVDCEVNITLNMLIAGEPPASCFISFELEGIDGTVVSEPGWFEYTVTNDISGNSCSGFLLVEDKLPPEIDCECESYLIDVDYLQGNLNSNSQIFNRPAVISDVGCESNFPVGYEVIEFTIESYSSNNFQSTNFDINGDNLFLSLYENCFDPSQPCTNLIEVAGTGLGSANLSESLEEGTTYFLVLSYFVNMGADLGNFIIDAGVGNGTVIIKNPNCLFKCTDLFDPSLLGHILPPLEEPYDNCDNFITLEPSISISDADECGSKIVTRSTGYRYNLNTGYQLTEYCVEEFLFEAVQLTGVGNTIDGVWEEYPASSIHDYYFPEKEIILPCGAGFHPTFITEYFDIDTPNTPSGEEDDYGQSETLVENQEGVPYATPYFVTIGFDGNYHASSLNNNACNLYVSYQDQLFDLCGAGCLGNSKTIRTWTINDWCKATSASYEQTIKVTDIDGPDLSVSDITVSVDPWDCYADIEMPAPDHLYDDCDNENDYWIQGPIGLVVAGYTAVHVPIGIHTFTYYGQDCCGNISTSEVKVTVRDNTPPVAITQESLVIQLTSNFQGDGFAKINAYDIDANSYDGCSDVKLEIKRNDGNIWCHLGNDSFNNDGHPGDLDTDDDNGEFVVFCCEDLILIDDNGQTYGLFDVQLRVWDDGDGNGTYGSAGDNYNEAWTTIRVEDKLAPQVICPENIEMTCNEDFTDMSFTGEPTAQGACFPSYCELPNDSYTRKPATSAPFIGEEIPAYNSSCRQGAIKRTWYCGGSNCLQWIIVRPTDDELIAVDWPSDRTVDCLGDDYGEPEFTDHICETIGTSLKSDTFFFETGTCFKILNNWSVINWCRYDPSDPDNNDIPEPGFDDGFAEGVYKHTQIIRLFDSVDPILTVKDSTVSSNSECLGEGIVLNAFAEDNGACGSYWLKWQVEVDLGSDWVVDYTYSTSLNPSDPYYLPPTMDTMYLSLPDGIMANCSQSHRVHWKVEDGCGNFASQTQNVTIKDLKKPTPYCLNLGSALMQNGLVELWARDFDAGSFDNCTDQEYLTYTFSSNIPPQLTDPTEEDPWYNDSGVTNQNNYITGDAEQWDKGQKSSSKIFDCDELEEAYNNGGVYSLPVYVWDLCGNFDFCLVNLQLTDDDGACGLADPRAMIAGTVERESGDLVAGMMMSVDANIPSYPKEIATDEEGAYAFMNNPMYNEYHLTGSKNDDWLNGITTLDILLIQKHILDIKQLDSPYKLIAADANSDEKITAVDLIKLRKLILGLIDEIPGNTSWRLVPKGETMDMSDLWPFMEMIQLSSLDQSEDEVDFIGIKIGDVNESAVTSINTTHITSRSLPQMSLKLEQNLSQEQNRIDFISTQEFETAGFQFALSGISGDYQIQSGELSMVAENHTYRNDALLVSWNRGQAITINEGSVLFSILCKEKRKLNLELRDDLLSNEIYVGDKLDTYKFDFKQGEEYESTRLYDVTPNPILNSAEVSFNLFEAQPYEIIITEVSGKQLTRLRGIGVQGHNRVEIDKSQLGLSSGLCFVMLKTNSEILSKKVSIID